MSGNKPVLLILAAGVGSRYGGLKQLDELGPNGETIMDYSIFDAIRSGFGKVVFVIKEAHRDLFETRIVPKFRSEIEIGYACQRIDDLPGDVNPPDSRSKPWGTGHAIFSARKEISQPFAVINADDFYGYGAFQTMAGVLEGLDPRSSEFCLIGYRVGNTLSEHGTVSRGLCGSRDGYLTTIKELTKVSRSKDRISYRENNDELTLDADAIISMNFWGFTPRIFDFVERGLQVFLDKQLHSPDAEYFITQPVDDAIKNSQASVQLLTTGEKWLGITYAEDKAAVVNGLLKRIDEGQYPAKLAGSLNRKAYSAF